MQSHNELLLKLLSVDLRDGSGKIGQTMCWSVRHVTDVSLQVIDLYK